MRELIANLFKVFGKYLFAGILYFITVVIWFFIFRDGIDSLYYPVMGVFCAVGITIASILYTIFFIIKNK